MSQHNIDIIQSEHGITADVRNMIEQTREGVAQTVKDLNFSHSIQFLDW